MDRTTLADLEDDGFVITYDPLVKAGYLKFPVTHNLGWWVTSEVSSNLNIDYDEDGNVVGVEFFG